MASLSFLADARGDDESTPRSPTELERMIGPSDLKSYLSADTEPLYRTSKYKDDLDQFLSEVGQKPLSIEDMTRVLQGFNRQQLVEIVQRQDNYIHQRALYTRHVEFEAKSFRDDQERALQDLKEEKETLERNLNVDSIDPVLETHPGLRPILRPKVWQRADLDPKSLLTRHEPTSEIHRTRSLAHHPQAGEFLRDDMESQVVELQIDLLLLRARQQFRRHLHVSMSNNAQKALELARYYFENYRPIQARCSVYLGIAWYLRSHFDKALEALADAEDCMGVYSEGEYVMQYRSRCEEEVEAPSLRNAEQQKEERTRSSDPSFGITEDLTLADAELHPVLNLEDEITRAEAGDFAEGTSTFAELHPILSRVNQIVRAQSSGLSDDKSKRDTSTYAELHPVLNLEDEIARAEASDFLDDMSDSNASDGSNILTPSLLGLNEGQRGQDLKHDAGSETQIDTAPATLSVPEPDRWHDDSSVSMESFVDSGIGLDHSVDGSGAARSRRSRSSTAISEGTDDFQDPSLDTGDSQAVQSIHNDEDHRNRTGKKNLSAASGRLLPRISIQLEDIFEDGDLPDSTSIGSQMSELQLSDDNIGTSSLPGTTTLPSTGGVKLGDPDPKSLPERPVQSGSSSARSDNLTSQEESRQDSHDSTYESVSSSQVHDVSRPRSRLSSTSLEPPPSGQLATSADSEKGN